MGPPELLELLVAVVGEDPSGGPTIELVLEVVEGLLSEPELPVEVEEPLVEPPIRPPLELGLILDVTVLAVAVQSCQFEVRGKFGSVTSPPQSNQPYPSPWLWLVGSDPLPG